MNPKKSSTLSLQLLWLQLNDLISGIWLGSTIWNMIVFKWKDVSAFNVGSPLQIALTIWMVFLRHSLFLSNRSTCCFSSTEVEHLQELQNSCLGFGTKSSVFPEWNNWINIANKLIHGNTMIHPHTLKDVRSFQNLHMQDVLMQYTIFFHNSQAITWIKQI